MNKISDIDLIDELDFERATHDPAFRRRLLTMLKLQRDVASSTTDAHEDESAGRNFSAA